MLRAEQFHKEMSDREPQQDDKNMSGDADENEEKRRRKLRKLKKDFKLAVEFVLGTEGEDPRVTQLVKLGFYALFKQATVGVCKDPAPSLFKPQKRLMWNAWSRLGDMEKTAAMRAYVKKLTKLEPDWKMQLKNRPNQQSSRL